MKSTDSSHKVSSSSSFIVGQNVTHGIFHISNASCCSIDIRSCNSLSPQEVCCLMYSFKCNGEYLNPMPCPSSEIRFSFLSKLLLLYELLYAVRVRFAIVCPHNFLIRSAACSPPNLCFHSLLNVCGIICSIDKNILPLASGCILSMTEVSPSLLLPALKR